MALPALETNEISWIGYWNFLDNGGDNIAPSTAKDAFDVVEEFSNGIQGLVTMPRDKLPDLTIPVRIKDDGWIVSWWEETGHTDYKKAGNGGANPIPSNPNSTIDVLWDRTNYQSKWPETLMSKPIKTAKKGLDNEAQATFNDTDVGYYEYQVTSATNLNFVIADGRDSTPNTGTFTLTNSSTLHRWRGAGYGSTRFNGNHYASHNSDSIYCWDFTPVFDPGQSVSYRTSSLGGSINMAILWS